MTVTPPQDQVLIDAGRQSLAIALSIVHQTETGAPALPPRHLLDHVIPALEDDSLGHTVIILPPGGAKTYTTMGACWWWFGDDPGQHIGYVCDTGPRAYERSVAIRDTIEQSPNYRAMFPRVTPLKDKGWGEGEWFLQRPNVSDKDPSMLALGVGGSILGWRGKRVVLDDIANEENMATELQRTKVRRWLQKTLMTRLMPNARVVQICTRWHDQDPAAWAIEQGWHVVHIPAIDDEGRSYWPEYWPIERLRCPNGCQPDPVHGKCLFDTRLSPPQWVNCKYRELGAMGFGQQYQGVTVDDESAIFQRGWWRRYRLLPRGANRGAIFIDTAGWDEKNPKSDRTACSAWADDGVRLYVVVALAGRWSFPDTVRILKDMRARFPSYPLVVEDTPWARPLIQVLKREIGNVIAWSVEGRSKLNRAKAVSPMVEAGDVLLPEEASWVGDWIEEHAQFPVGTHDDWVDTASMAGLYFRKGRAKPRKTGERYGMRLSEVRA